MIVKTITNNDSGRKWEIIKEGNDLYVVKYYENYKSTGWRCITEESGYSKDGIEWEFDCEVA